MEYRNTQQQLINWLMVNPCKKELEIVRECFGGWTVKKKYADLIRRALRAGKIDRVRIKFKGIDKRMVYRYFVK